MDSDNELQCHQPGHLEGHSKPPLVPAMVPMVQADTQDATSVVGKDNQGDPQMSQNPAPGQSEILLEESRTVTVEGPHGIHCVPASVRKIRPMCHGKTQTGEPCRRKPLPGMDLCAKHQKESLVQSRALALIREQAGPIDLSSGEGCREVLASTIRLVREGAVTPSVAQAVASCIQANTRLAELSLEARLARLTELLEAQEGK